MFHMSVFRVEVAAVTKKIPGRHRRAPGTVKKLTVVCDAAMKIFRSWRSSSDLRRIYQFPAALFAFSGAR